MMASSKNAKAGRGDKTDIEEIEWLATLSESELDFLISLEDLVSIRAESIGHKDLTQKFDLKVLRALAFVLLEYFKDRVKNVPDIPIVISNSLRNCRLLDLNCDENAAAVTPASKSSTKDVSFACSRRKRMWDGLKERSSSCKKKQKTTDDS